MLATGEKTPTPARRAAPSSSSPSASTKNAREGVTPVPVPVPGAEGVDVGVVRLVEIMPVGDSGGEIGSGSGSVGGRVLESPSLAIWEESDLGGSWVANEDLWEVEAVGSPSVRAMT